MIQRDGLFRARCSHRGCGATGPKMRSITRAADLFCCPPEELTAARAAIAALHRQVCRLVSGHAIESDSLCQHHGADVAALAQLATLKSKIEPVRVLYAQARRDYATIDDDGRSIAGHELVDAVANLLDAVGPEALAAAEERGADAAQGKGTDDE